MRKYENCQRTFASHRDRRTKLVWDHLLGNTRLSQLLMLVSVTYLFGLFAAELFAQDGISTGPAAAYFANSLHSDNPQPLPSAPEREPAIIEGTLFRRKKIRRTRADIRREREELYERTMREIDALVAEFHAKLPRDQAESVGALYARYSSRFQDSIVDQVRSLLEAAVAMKVFIPRDHVFFDMATRGWKDRRPGLDALRLAIEQRAFTVFLVFATARLFRKAYRSMQFAEEELVENGIRGIFLKSGLDTANGDHWRMMLQSYASMDEAMVRLCGAHVQASHEGLFIRQMVWGSLSLGYTGEEVPGELTRRQRPRRKIVIDCEEMKWILKIYRWYVEERHNCNKIAQYLNADPDAPAPKKSFTGLWTARLVRKVLKNAVYRGFWCYGASETKWQSAADYARQVPRLNPIRSGHFEELRIVSDELWYRAQEMLAKESGNSGRRSLDGDTRIRPRFLRGLFSCPEHDRRLVVGGPDGRILFCPLCRAILPEQRPLFTHLNRQIALQRTCQTLAELVRCDDDLIEEIVVACQRAATEFQEPDPDELKRLRSQIQRLSGAIEFNRRNPGETEAEQQQTMRLLKELRGQLHEVSAKLSSLEAVKDRKIVIPSYDEVRSMLQELSKTLATAASAETDDQMCAARQIIDELTGGRIELFQQGERKAQRGWLQGRFRIDFLSVAIERLTGTEPVESSDGNLEVVIDYRERLLTDDQAEQAKALWDEGLLCVTIAERMQRSKAYITTLLKRWFKSRGLPYPDGRKRRHEVINKQRQIPRYQRIADQVVRLLEQGHSKLAIAHEFQTSDATIMQAIDWWYASHNQPKPTAKSLRNKRIARAKTLLDSGVLLTDIASTLGYSTRGLTLALRAYLAELGQSLPDGRSMRGNAAAGESANGHSASGNVDPDCASDLTKTD